MTFLNNHTHAASQGGIVETGGIGLGLLFPSWLLMATRDMALQWFSTIKHPWKIMTRHDNKISTLTIICIYQKMVQTSFVEIGGGESEDIGLYSTLSLWKDKQCHLHINSFIYTKSPCQTLAIYFEDQLHIPCTVLWKNWYKNWPERGFEHIYPGHSVQCL